MTNTSFGSFVNGGSGVGTSSEGQTISTLLAALAGGLAGSGAQLLVFLLLRIRLSRIYRPRTYLVAERERVAAPPRGIVRWLVPIFATANLEFIQKCGLDAYFFLRYLRMLLKIFFPLALILLPILLPLNRYSGPNQQAGLDTLSISNVRPAVQSSRLWAHLILAIGVIAWVCYVVYKELRGYIRVRQAYLSSPQHRIRASATTVLITGIPRKWLSLDALNGLYDVFPGGIRNIWINRNFDELSDKVQLRDGIAQQLESAETNLIQQCREKHLKAVRKQENEEGKARKTKAQRKQDAVAQDAEADRMAQGDGVSAGDQHQKPQNVQEMLDEVEHQQDVNEEKQRKDQVRNPFGILNQGLGAVGLGFGAIGKAGAKVVGDVSHGINDAVVGADHTLDHINAGDGFVSDEALYRQSHLSTGSSVPPIPPPKAPARNTPALTHMPLPRSEETDFDHDRAGDEQSAITGRRQPREAATPIFNNDSPPSSSNEKLAPRVQLTRPSDDSRPKEILQIEEPAHHMKSPSKWEFWKLDKHGNRDLYLPSPQPHMAEEDEFPLRSNQARKTDPAELNENPNQEFSSSKLVSKFSFLKGKKGENGEKEESFKYPTAFAEDLAEDPTDIDTVGEHNMPQWCKYIQPKDRETLREPIVNQSWFPRLPFLGKKIDRIYYLRRELARLNQEIEIDQADVERFPIMNSAFIQFNHQVAAHMCCQSLSHHVPQSMAPRIVEISPNDVIWGNLSIKWWERYVRTIVVLIISAALIILYAFPVAFTSLLSNVNTLAADFQWLAWIKNLPTPIISIIQGILPAILLSLVLILVPIIFRFLVKNQGVPTGNATELGVQDFYFVFLFVQVFLVVTLSKGITAFIGSVYNNPTGIPGLLAQNLPKAANYFFSYLMIQALGNSAGALAQILPLLMWFLLAPIMDNTARQKWTRQTTLQNVQWGSFFPPFTNFAVIGLVYSVITPFILVFMVIIFAIYWIVYRYNILYVFQFRNDTGGLLFPKAINQLFTGLYVMELCLVGFFFISTNCVPQAVIMIVALICTIIYQWQLNAAFDPLFQYLPITLEDEAVIRDEEFARAQQAKFQPEEVERGDYEDELEARERAEAEAEERAEAVENQREEERRRSHPQNNSMGSHRDSLGSIEMKPAAAVSWKSDRWRTAAKAVDPIARIRQLTRGEEGEQDADGIRHRRRAGARATPEKANRDVEAQHTVGDVLFSGFADELEDLTPEERDTLVRYAFQHQALRARRPVIWIPRDELGVSDDEIRRCKRMSTVTKDGKGEKETNIWISNEGTALDSRGRVVFRRSPPDFSSVDLMEL